MSNPTTKTPSLIGGRSAARREPPPPQPPPAPVKWYRVTSPDKKITQPQGGVNQEFVLRMGKEISSASYNIAFLRNRGVTLEELTSPPGWWNEAQQKGLQRHEDLTAKGIELADPVPLEPAPAA